MNTPTISAAHLAVGYGHRAVVDHIDVTLNPGDLLVLIGTNGSGKSTLLKTLAGLIEPLAGDLVVGGGRAGSQPRNVAYLPQHPVSTHASAVRARCRRNGSIRPTWIVRSIDG